MRKYLAVILASMLCLSLCACTGGTASEGASESSALSQSASKTEISGSKEEVSKSESSVSGSEVSKSESSVSGAEASKSESSVSGAEVSKNESSGAEASKSESSAEESSEESSEESLEQSSEKSLEESLEESFVESSAEESVPQESSREQSRLQPQPAGTPVDASWFDDAVFIGDSVTLRLSYYADNGDLGEAAFLCAGSLGYHNCHDDIDKEGNVHPTYMGEKCTIFDGVGMIKPKKVFVMFGMNDIGLCGVDGTVTLMQEVMEKLKESCPDAVYYVQPVTPMIAGYSRGDLNNENIRAFDEKLKAVCDEKGYRFIDIYSAVSDENGDLPLSYCGDIPSDDNPNGMGLHFSDKGCEVWVDYLKTHVGQ